MVNRRLQLFSQHLQIIKKSQELEEIQEDCQRHQEIIL